MGNTPSALLPYPEGTDFVMDGDDAIRALAEALDTKVFALLAQDAHAGADTPDLYPAGVSVMPVSSASVGWPTTTGLVITQKFDATRVQQFFYSTLSRAWYRSGNATVWTNTGWVGMASPYAQADGSASITSAPAGTHSDITVTLPSGRFSQPPVVTATSRTSIPFQLGAVGITGTTTSSFVLTVMNNTSSARGISVYWMAAQATDTSALGLMAAAAARLAAPAGDAGDAGDTATVTCPNPECMNYGIPITIRTSWVDEEGNTRTVTNVSCGGCGTDISDTITPIEDGGDES